MNQMRFQKKKKVKKTKGKRSIPHVSALSSLHSRQRCLANERALAILPLEVDQTPRGRRGQAVHIVKENGERVREKEQLNKKAILVNPASVAEAHERRCARPFVTQLLWTDNVTVITLTTRGAVSIYMFRHCGGLYSLRTYCDWRFPSNDPSPTSE